MAFANTSGGTLLIGVEDGTAYVRGVSEPLDLEERLANLISDSITPRLIADIDLAIASHALRSRANSSQYPAAASSHTRWCGKWHFHPCRIYEQARRCPEDSGNAPVGTWGDFRRTTYARSRLGSAGLPRDASESFADVHKLTRRELETLRLLSKHQGHNVPTGGGVLLFGRDRERHFPDAWTHAGRFAGGDKARILDRAEIRALPITAINEAITFVEKHSIHSADIGRVRRIDRSSYPPVAVREAGINAVVHVDYTQRGAPRRIAIFDDRMEIENPGLLPFSLTIEDLEDGVTKLRNRVIGRILNELGLIEQLGSGIQRMLPACLDAGLAPPRFEEIATRFRVTLFSERVERPTLDDIHRTIVDTLSNNEGKLTSEIAEVIGLAARATRTRLARFAGNAGCPSLRRVREMVAAHDCRRQRHQPHFAQWVPGVPCCASGSSGACKRLCSLSNRSSSLQFGSLPLRPA